MSEQVPALPPLTEDGQFPVTFSEEDYDRLERARLDASLTATERHAELATRLDMVSADLTRVLNVIAQLEAFLAQVMPAVDQIAANPAKFLMSLMSGGGKNGR